jgi:hypothetical protein
MASSTLRDLGAFGLLCTLPDVFEIRQRGKETMGSDEQFARRSAPGGPPDSSRQQTVPIAEELDAPPAYTPSSTMPGSNTPAQRSHTDAAPTVNGSNAGYVSPELMSISEPNKKDYSKYENEPGCCCSESGGCCGSKHGACCFSDHGACCFSDNEACCFSDHQACCFSDNRGCCFSKGRKR